MNPLGLLSDGGPVVAVILLASLYGAFVFFEKLQKLNRATAGQDKLLHGIGQSVLAGHLLEAVAHANAANTPLGRVLAAGLERLPLGAAAVEAAVEDAVTSEEASASRGLTTLSTVAQVAPLLGLLGTVIGLIRSFGALAAAGGQPTLTDLAGGISLALTATASGLTVAILFYVAHNYLSRRVDAVVTNLDRVRPLFAGWLIEAHRRNESERNPTEILWRGA